MYAPVPFRCARLITAAAIGLTFVTTSFLQLGITGALFTLPIALMRTGTFLGDYFGILMSHKVTGFPFNVLDNPMYVGSTLLFLAHALRYALAWTGFELTIKQRERSFAGLVVTAWVFIVYEIAATFYEGYVSLPRCPDDQAATLTWVSRSYSPFTSYIYSQKPKSKSKMPAALKAARKNE